MESVRSEKATINQLGEDFNVVLFPANHASNGASYYHFKIGYDTYSMQRDEIGKWSSKSKNISSELCNKIGAEMERLRLM